jgi:hypothetical protein
VRGDLGELDDIAELGRLGELAAADGPSLDVEERDHALRDLLAGEALADLTGDALGEGRDAREPLEGTPARLWRCPAGTRARAACLAQKTARLAHAVAHQSSGLLGEPLHRGLRLAGAPRQRASELAQPPPDRAAAVTDARAGRRDSGMNVTRRACEDAHRLGAQAGVGGIADVGLDHRRVDAQGARAEAALPRRERDDPPDERLGHLGAQAPGELAHRGLVGDALVDRDEAEAP